MRTQFALLLSATLILVGCGPSESAKPATPAAPPAAPAPKEAEKKADSSSGGSVVSAPTDYLSSLAKAKHSADASLDAVALKDLNTQVQAFFGQEGRFPKDLNEMVTMKYVKALPSVPAGSKLEYNAANGTVTVVKQ